EHLFTRLRFQLSPAGERLLREPHPLRLGVGEAENTRAAVTGSASMSALELLVYDDLVPGTRERAGSCETHYSSSDDGDLGHYTSTSLLVSSHARLVRGRRACVKHRPRSSNASRRPHMKTKAPSLASTALAFVLATFADAASPSDFNDSHSHLTNYIQEGLSLPEFIRIMGDTTGRAAVFGIPLQQKWDYFESGARAPDY